MNCPSLDELSAYRTGEPAGPRRESAGVAAHVSGCQACQRRMVDLEAERAAIANLLRSRPPRRRGDCPAWESLAAYAELGFDGTGTLEDHLEGCEACLLRLALFRMAEAEAGRELPVLSGAVPSPDVERPWVWAFGGAGWGGKWWILGGATALAALGVLAILMQRDPKETTLALSRPPVIYAPGPGGSLPPSGARPGGLAETPGPVASGAELGGPGNGMGTPRPDGPLYRSLPRSKGPVDVLFRYSLGREAHEAWLPMADAPILRSGDRFSFKVATTAPMWVYVFQEDGRNLVSTLFPNAGFHTGVNPVNAPDGRTIPAPGQDFALDETTGMERVYIFYGPARVDRCERLLSLVGSHSVDSDVRQILRELVRAGEAGDPSVIGYTAMRFSFHHEP